MTTIVSISGANEHYNGMYYPYKVLDSVVSYKKKNVEAYLFRYDDAFTKWWILTYIEDDPFTDVYTLVESLSTTPPNDGWSVTNMYCNVITVKNIKEKELKNSYDEQTSSDSTKYIGHEKALIPEESLIFERNRRGLD